MASTSVEVGKKHVEVENENSQAFLSAGARDSTSVEADIESLQAFHTAAASKQDLEAPVTDNLTKQPEDTDAAPGAKKPRLYYIDSLRTWLTLLVVVHHCFWVVLAGWIPFYRPWEPAIPTIIFGYMLLPGDQAYFMGLFFFLSGLVTAPSLKRKGPWVFLKDRFYRLMIPAILYDFVFFPLLVCFVNSTWDVPMGASTFSFAEVWPWYFEDLGRTVFVMNHMWFLVTLFALSLIAVGLIHSVESWKEFVFTQHPLESISQKSMVFLLIKMSSILVVLNSLVRFLFPAGYPWYPVVGNLGFIMQYILAFTAGILANSYQFLDHIRISHLRVTLCCAIFFYFLFIICQVYLYELLQAIVGFYLHTFLRTLFEQFFAVFWSYSLLGYFKEYRNEKPSQFFSRLIGSAYATYIVHQWIIVPLAVGFAYTDLYAIVVILVLVVIAPPLAWSAGLLFKAIPGSDIIL